MSTATGADIEAFFDLVCHDPELLQAEFAAIVADCWDRPPEWPMPLPRPGPPHRPDPARGSWPAVAPALRGPVVRTRHVGRGRQRGPPGRRFFGEPATTNEKEGTAARLR